MSEPTPAEVEASVQAVLDVLTPQWARHWAARYNAPVYLTGSILTNPHARDIDIRIPVPDVYFAARFGNAWVKQENGTQIVEWQKEGPTQKWVDEIAKVNEHLSKQLGRVVDLQIWPESHWREAYPPPVLLAQPTPRWWVYSKYCPEPVFTEGPSHE